jgi:hypothetical protein
LIYETQEANAIGDSQFESPLVQGSSQRFVAGENQDSTAVSFCDESF